MIRSVIPVKMRPKKSINVPMTPKTISLLSESGEPKVMGGTAAGLEVGSVVAVVVN